MQKVKVDSYATERSAVAHTIYHLFLMTSLYLHAVCSERVVKGLLFLDRLYCAYKTKEQNCFYLHLLVIIIYGKKIAATTIRRIGCLLVSSWRMLMVAVDMDELTSGRKSHIRGFTFFNVARSSERASSRRGQSLRSVTSTGREWKRNTHTNPPTQTNTISELTGARAVLPTMHLWSRLLFRRFDRRLLLLQRIVGLIWNWQERQLTVDRVILQV